MFRRWNRAAPLFPADSRGSLYHGRFHRDEREHLQHVILYHVAQRARFLVITSASAHADLFANGDLHMVNGIAIPKPLEDGVGETEHQNVLHRFLAKIMVNAENLL